MRALVFGALLGLLVVVFGVPIVPVVEVLAVLAQPVTIAFALGLTVRTRLPRARGWTA